VGAILILALMKKDQSSLIKKFATAWFALDFIASLWLVEIQPRRGRHAVSRRPQWIPIIGARYQMGVDGVAVLLIVLTTLLGASSRRCRRGTTFRNERRNITFCCCCCRRR
jgi:NADH-quinone oxidoreductase subunit M